jgi:hypothetical protein
MEKTMPNTDSINIDNLIGAIKLYPFPDTFQQNFPDYPLIISWAMVKCPKCKVIDNIYSTSKGYKLEMKWCKGSQPAEFDCQHPITGQHYTHETPCAGISVEHFHVHCICCHYEFFMSLPNEETSKWEE